MSTGANWDDAYTSISYAMLTASVGDEIWVAQGTYYPNLDQNGNFWSGQEGHHWFKNGIKLLGGFLGNEFFEWQRDPVNQKASLSGSSYNNNVVRIDNQSAVTIDGFQIYGGFSNSSSAVQLGAGIFIQNATDIILRNLEISNNQAENHGGGIYSNNASILLENSRLNNNTTYTYDGAACYFNVSYIEINNCLFNWNSASRYGGAITTVASSIDVANSTFYENSGNQNQFQHSTSGSIKYNHSIFDNVNDFSGLDLGSNGSASVTFNECLISPDLYFPATKNSCVTSHANFTNAGANDYTQTPTSPGVEMPISLASLNQTTVDIAGNTRTIGDYMDLGAYEACSFVATASQNNVTLTANQNNATYQWVTCPTNQPISGANSQTFVATANGDYAVSISYPNGCTVLSTCYTVNSISSAILNENSINDLLIYPNPAITEITISTESNFEKILITDITGNVLIESLNKNINIIELPSGIYFINLLGDLSTIRKRFVKQ
jgi:predicted outer membrane repeat protein